MKDKLKIKNDSKAFRSSQVKFGCEHFLESEIDIIKGKKIGLVTNHSAVLQNGKHIVDVLRGEHGVKITALFSPEHGIRGNAPAGAHLNHEKDPDTGLQIYSLYGEQTKPENWMLENIDVLIYDIQDAGTRFYTYISTMALAMEAAAENKITFLILDRPMITSGELIDGPLLHEDNLSFIGLLPVPVLYSLTPGELAGLVQEEYLHPKGLCAELHVIRLQNYSRSMWYDETQLPWLIPSPNVPTIETATIYPGTALVEGTNVSEGRGTPYPFQYIGAPFIEKDALTATLSNLEIPGVQFQPLDFVPRQSSFVIHPRFLDQVCHGVFVEIVDRKVLKPVEVGIAIVCAIRKLHPEHLRFRADGAFDRLIGDKKIMPMIEAGAGYEEVADTWKDELICFAESRTKYFLYP